MKSAEKTSQNGSRTNEERIEAYVEEFIPYACHFDDHTLLTKNGELMQVIKVTGFNFETVGHKAKEASDLRETLRQTIQKTFKTNKFALWLHTVRQKKNLATGGEYPEDFASRRASAGAAGRRYDDKTYGNYLE